MKTAIEELIEELQNGFLEDKFNNSSDILLLCEKYQSKEKHQIIEAVTYGNRMEFYDGTETSGEQYYNENFKNE